ncbi:hypothetical protein BXZ70DRAFT_932405 [Cristinia sonorae]|uniref:Uncharacterized protein n=1 Tax=Cristinia sonorae TaxID=1940300 RepID=A0A8K0UQ62_9AGAR|nr:hypothetical protein BXZ70DRAFT_932405 [Cristinia sonorae]
MLLILLRTMMKRYFAKKVKSPPITDEVERQFRKTERDRTQTYECIRRQQQYDFALATESWLNSESIRAEVFHRIVREALDDYYSLQQQRAAEFGKMLETHDKLARADDAQRQARFDEDMSERTRLFQAAQERRKVAISQYAAYRDRLYEEGRHGRQVETEKLVDFLRELFGKVMREAESARAEPARGNQTTTGNTSPTTESLSTPTLPELQIPTINASGHPESAASTISTSPSTSDVMPPPPSTPPSPHSDRPRSSSRHASGEGSRSPNTPFRSSPPQTPKVPPPGTLPNSTTINGNQIHGTPVVSDTYIDCPPEALPKDRARGIGEESVRAPTFEPSAGHGISRQSKPWSGLDIEFDDCETRRTSTFTHDRNTRLDLVCQIKDFIRQSGEKRSSQFVSVLKQFDTLIERLKASCSMTLLVHENSYDRPEVLRQQKFLDAQTCMDFLFEDMMSMMGEEASSMQEIQRNHDMAHIDKVDALLNSMGAMVDERRAPSPTTRPNIPFPLPPTQRVRQDESRKEWPMFLPPPLVDPPSQPVFMEPFSIQALFDNDGIISNELPIASDIPKFSIPNTSGFITSDEQELPARSLGNTNHSKMFQRHSAMFLRGQTHRDTLFRTELHQYHQEIAALEVKAGFMFKRDLRDFKEQLSSAWLAHTTKFNTFLMETNSTLGNHEQLRLDWSRSAQDERRATFGKSQREKHQAFVERRERVRSEDLDLEATIARNFLVWKEEKFIDAERMAERWQRTLKTPKEPGSMVDVTDGL